MKRAAPDTERFESLERSVVKLISHVQAPAAIIALLGEQPDSASIAAASLGKFENLKALSDPKLKAGIEQAFSKHSSHPLVMNIAPALMDHCLSDAIATAVLAGAASAPFEIIETPMKKMALFTPTSKDVPIGVADGLRLTARGPTCELFAKTAQAMLLRLGQPEILNLPVAGAKGLLMHVNCACPKPCVSAIACRNLLKSLEELSAKSDFLKAPMASQWVLEALAESAN